MSSGSIPTPRRRIRLDAPWLPPRIRGVSRQRRIEIEQTLARTGSVAATMGELEVSYETCRLLLEWMAA